MTRVPLAFPAVGMPEIEPNRELVEHYIRKLQLGSAAAVMVVHSHFDHTLDAPTVAELTSATLLGSESTANIGRGLKLPESLSALGMNKTIDQPLVPPAPFIAYREGKTYSIPLEHPRGNLLIQGSAGFIPGALQGLKADYVMLSTGGLGDLEGSEQEDYFRNIVTTTGAKAVFPIHWDTMVPPWVNRWYPIRTFSVRWPYGTQALRDKRHISDFTAGGSGATSPSRLKLTATP